MRLTDFALDSYSQNGEDGMIERLLSWLNITAGLAVEFGAWDGFHFSNTANLWTRDGEHGRGLWRAVLIEGDASKAQLLELNVKPYAETVKSYCRTVGIEVGTRWQDTPGAENADLVSIDIDGNDYWVFKASPQGPAVYVVEYNGSVPPWLDVWTPYDPKARFGCSLKALCRLATEKGYAFIGASETNGFFLRGDLKSKLPKDLDCDPRAAFKFENLTYLMSSFDGEYVASKVGPWGRTRHYDKPLCFDERP